MHAKTAGEIIFKLVFNKFIKFNTLPKMIARVSCHSL